MTHAFPYSAREELELWNTEMEQSRERWRLRDAPVRAPDWRPTLEETRARSRLLIDEARALVAVSRAARGEK